MRVVRHVVLSVAVLWAATGDLHAQAVERAAPDAERIWAAVETVSGDTLQGFLRWDRDQAGWSDLLTATRGVSRDIQRIWRVATGRGEDLPRRVVEVAGFRVSWNEDDPDFPTAASAGVRFGHIREIRPAGNDAATVTLHSGQEIGLSGGGTDLGRDIREILVEAPGRDPVSLEWDEVARVALEPSPPDAGTPAHRVHGTATDRWGNRYTGYVTWDRTGVLTRDVFVEGGDGSRGGGDLRFSEVTLLERTWDGARVTLTNREVRELRRSALAGRARDVRISDPRLGRVEIEWDDLESVRFHPPDPGSEWPVFDGGRPLRATVTTRAGAAFTGRVLWDADEESTWQMLDGERRGVRFQVEFGEVARVERVSSREARVTLRDGRTLELEGSNDVGEGNRGILVLPDGSEEWMIVPWSELESARFDYE